MTDSPLTPALEKAREAADAAAREAWQGAIKHAAIAGTVDREDVLEAAAAAHNAALDAHESTLAAEMKRMDMKVVGPTLTVDLIEASEGWREYDCPDWLVERSEAHVLYSRCRAMHAKATCELQKALGGGEDG